MRARREAAALMLTLLALLSLAPRAAGEEDEEGVRCYECGTGVAGQPDCHQFLSAASWASFWRQCPRNHLCVKTSPLAHDHASLPGSRVVRGCSPRVSLAGRRHQDGCWAHPASATLTCFCSSALCNPAPASPRLSLAALSAALLTLAWHL